METEKLYELHWSICDKATGKPVRNGHGVYCGVNLTDAQRDAVEDTDDFDPETQVMVFDEDDYIEMDVPDPTPVLDYQNGF